LQFRIPICNLAFTISAANPGCQLKHIFLATELPAEWNHYFFPIFSVSLPVQIPLIFCVAGWSRSDLFIKLPVAGSDSVSSAAVGAQLAASTTLVHGSHDTDSGCCHWQSSSGRAINCSGSRTDCRGDCKQRVQYTRTLGCCTVSVHCTVPKCFSHGPHLTVTCVQ
jgi:hypothetical protein